jgi:DNA polymerase-3 subunit delta'
VSASAGELDQVLGHAWVRAVLRAELAADRVAPCYLFAGPPGIGKRTLALALLRAFLCLARRADGGACGECAACRASERGAHPDLHCVAAPREGRKLEISHAREQVIEVFDLAPKLSPRRGVLVDGAEALSEEAQNALLKTLEEPPEGACLVLVATSETALLPTILSRSRLLRFGRPAREEGLEILRSAFPGSASEAEIEEALDLAAGSPGAALELAGSELYSERATFAGWLRGGAPATAELRELLPGLEIRAGVEGTLAERRERLRGLWQLTLAVAGRELRAACGVGAEQPGESGREHPAEEPTAWLAAAERCRVWAELGQRALEDLDAMVTPELVFELWAAGLPRAGEAC